MIIYLSGPITGKKNGNKLAFAQAEKKLTAQGHIVLNPAAHPGGLNGYLAYLDIDLAMIRHSDAIYLLNGWDSSKGALFEKAYAELLNKTIYYQ